MNWTKYEHCYATWDARNQQCLVGTVDVWVDPWSHSIVGYELRAPGYAPVRTWLPGAEPPDTDHPW